MWIVILLTNFDILPSGELNQLIFNFQDDIELNDRFTDLGYDSLNCVDNMGSFLYYLIIVVFLLFKCGVMYILTNFVKNNK